MLMQLSSLAESFKMPSMNNVAVATTTPCPCTTFTPPPQVGTTVRLPTVPHAVVNSAKEKLYDATMLPEARPMQTFLAMLSCGATVVLAISGVVYATSRVRDKGHRTFTTICCKEQSENEELVHTYDFDYDLEVGPDSGTELTSVWTNQSQIHEATLADPQVDGELYEYEPIVSQPDAAQSPRMMTV